MPDVHTHGALLFDILLRTILQYLLHFSDKGRVFPQTDTDVNKCIQFVSLAVAMVTKINNV